MPGVTVTGIVNLIIKFTPPLSSNFRQDIIIALDEFQNDKNLLKRHGVVLFIGVAWG